MPCFSSFLNINIISLSTHEMYLSFNAASTYGKAFLPPNTVNNNEIYETSKILRIVSHLR